MFKIGNNVLLNNCLFLFEKVLILMFCLLHSFAAFFTLLLKRDCLFRPGRQEGSSFDFNSFLETALILPITFGNWGAILHE